jgi:hypothetical protein
LAALWIDRDGRQQIFVRPVVVRPRQREEPVGRFPFIACLEKPAGKIADFGVAEQLLLGNFERFAIRGTEIFEIVEAKPALGRSADVIEKPDCRGGRQCQCHDDRKHDAQMKIQRRRGGHRRQTIELR